MSRTQYAVLIIVLLIVVAYGAFTYISKDSPKISWVTSEDEESELTPAEEEVVPSDSAKEQKPVIISVEKIERDIKEVLDLKDVTGGNAEAQAVLSVQNGKLTLSLRAPKLPDPGNGGYAGWLYKEGSSVPIYVGPLSKVPNGEFKDHYALGFQGGSELSAYKTIVVTRQTIASDFSAPGKKILEGKFK